MGQVVVEDGFACVDRAALERGLQAAYWDATLPGYEIWAGISETDRRGWQLEVAVDCDPAGETCAELGRGPWETVGRAVSFLPSVDCPSAHELVLTQARLIIEGQPLDGRRPWGALELGASAGSGPSASRGHLAVSGWTHAAAGPDLGWIVRTLVGAPIAVPQPTACLGGSSICDDDDGRALYGAVQAGGGVRVSSARFRAGLEALAGPLLAAGSGLEPSRWAAAPLVDLAGTLSWIARATPRAAPAPGRAGPLEVALRVEVEPVTAAFLADTAADPVELPPLRAGLGIAVPIGGARFGR